MSHTEAPPSEVSTNVPTKVSNKDFSRRQSRLNAVSATIGATVKLFY